MKRGGRLQSTELKRTTGMPQRSSGLKPGGPWQRRTELGRGTNPLLRSAPLARKTEPCSSAKKPKRQRDTGPSKDVKDFLRKHRAKGRCERCRSTGPRLDVHHRRARKMGGTTRPEINNPENLLVLCRPCHLSITATNGRRAEYEFAGLLIREDLRDPVDVKVELADGWYFLTTAGGRTPTTPPEAAA